MMVLLITTLAFKNTAHTAPVPVPATASAADAISHEEHPRPYINSGFARHADDAAPLVDTEEPEDRDGFLSRWRRRDFDVDDKPEVYTDASSEGYVDNFRFRQ